MAMRDPGRPGRNPFFDHGPEAELGDLPDAFGPEVPLGPQAWPGGGGADPLGTLAALVDALQGAQPEATEHLIAAAHELVLAVKTVVDATEAVLAASRAAASDPGEAAYDDSVHDPFASSDEPPPASPRSGVRRIDLA
jgi:hypothetical protein